MKVFFCNGKQDYCLNCDAMQCQNCKHCDGSGGKEIETLDNPYWERLNLVYMRQRSKGIETYGQGIESNPAAIKQRIEMALEELVDLGLYLCWICDGISEKGNDLNEKTEDNSKTR